MSELLFKLARYSYTTEEIIHCDQHVYIGILDPIPTCILLRSHTHLYENNNILRSFYFFRARPIIVIAGVCADDIFD